MIDELHDTGLHRLGVVPWVDEFTDYLAKCEKFPGHVKARPRDGIWCNQMSDVMAAPHFLDYAKSFTPFASKFFGEPAHLWSLNAFYSDGNTPYIKGIHALHHDLEAPKILCLFLLGTDTAPEGAQILATGGDQWAAIWGIAGKAWLADTTRLHCGLIQRKPRMLAWARWANVIPEAKHSEGLPDVV